MSGRTSRNKGQRGEREFFARMNEFLPENLRMARTLDQTRDGGSDGHTDLFAIEVKRCETLSLPKWLAQARAQASNGQTPVLAYRQNRGDWNILVDMSEPELAAYIEWRHHGCGDGMGR